MPLFQHHSLTRHRSRRTFYFTLTLVLFSISNLFPLYYEIQRINIFKQYFDHHLLGFQFDGLKEFVGDTPVMGYFTDLDIEDQKNLKLFSEAQFLLAPTILDLNNLTHRYTFFVCSNEKIAWLLIKKLNLMPLRRNRFGMILAERPT